MYFIYFTYYGQAVWPSQKIWIVADDSVNLLTHSRVHPVAGLSDPDRNLSMRCPHGDFLSHKLRVSSDEVGYHVSGVDTLFLGASNDRMRS